MDGRTTEKAAKPTLTPAQRKKRQAKRNAILRAAVQTVFFFSMPGAFVAGFSGAKSLARAIGAGQPLSWTGFTAALAVLCVFTILFGRFFCGYVCAFGSLGDLVWRLSGLVQTGLLRRKKRLRLPERFTPWGQKLKYVVLAGLLLLSALGLEGRVNSFSPWSVFSFFMALRFDLSGYWAGFAVLLLIVIGMAFKERFFCQFLCPMGAIFSLLPLPPFASLRRDPENCIPRCQACRMKCPVDIKLEPDGFRNGECIGCERCADVCPRSNLTRWDRRLLHGGAASVLIRAGLFFALGVWLGLCRFL